VEGTELSPLKNKEKKDIVVKKAPCGVQNFLEDALHRPLTADEQATITQLEALDPSERNGLLEQLKGSV
jgi:hypothetical protein